MSMEVVVCLDNKFVMPTGVMMYSLCMNNQDVDINFHVVTDTSVTQRDKDDLNDNLKDFERHVNLFFYTIKEKKANLPSIANRQGLTYVTYHRLFLADVLPDNIDKVLYLDGDVVVRHSLLPLWNTDLTDYAVAGVCDALSGVVDFYNRLNYPKNAGYFNAGVLLINLKYWRENKVSTKFMDYIQSQKIVFLFHDQDILNGLFWDKKVLVPIKYNVTNGFLQNNASYDSGKYKDEVLEARRDPVIIHFANIYKPWESYIRFPHPFSNSFYKYQSQTRWRGVKIEVRPLQLRIKNYVADILRKMRIKAPLSFDYIQIDPVD